MDILIRKRNYEETTGHLPGDLHPVLARVYRARGITSPDQLDQSLNRLCSYTALSGIQQAAELLYKAMQSQGRILVIGDFDADGATSCALAVRALRSMGAVNVDYLVPNRFEFGYGLTPEIVAIAADKNPDLIITVDNGISSIEGVSAAKKRGIDVLVTDHHLSGRELPPADAIVNPNLKDDEFPSKGLAGVGTIFYVMTALRAYLRERSWFTKLQMEEPNLATLLDLVALGTVADVVPLDHNNRILVAQGLARICRQRCCAGISALAKVAGRQQNRMVASDLAFALGPRLNAAGRMDDMSLGIECLLTDDNETAMQLAAQLNELNLQRRNVENEMKAQAFASLNKMQLDDDSLSLGLCLYEDDWHQGVIGILASRLKEKYHRPVIVFAGAGQDAENGEYLIKGSARSIQGFHIRDGLDAIAAKHPGLVNKFGGHAMAAGLTLRREDFVQFSKAFDQEVSRYLGREDLLNIIYSDGELDGTDMTLTLAELVRAAGPWGQAFPEPVFSGELRLVERKVVGERHLKVKLQVPGESKVVEAIAFNTTDKDWPPNIKSVQIAYKLDVNDYRGVRSLQFILEFIRPIVSE